MPIPTYTSGYPPDGSSLGQTKSTIRNNLDGTFQTLNVDHINNNGLPGSQPAGYHTIIHEVPQTSVSTVSGYNQLFSSVPNVVTINGSPITNPVPNTSDQQLFSLTGGGVLSQLTGHSASTSGYQWIGGVLLQWGQSNFSGSSTTLTFAFNTGGVNFPNSCFQVFAVLSGQQAAISVDSFNQTNCSVTRASGSTPGVLMRYFAIGN